MFAKIIIVNLFLVVACSQKQKTTTDQATNDIPIQIKFDSTAGSYEETIIVSNTKKTMTFRTYSEDSATHTYSYMEYHTDSPLVHLGMGVYPRTSITDEISDIKRLWDTAKIRVSINLKW